MKTKNFSFVGLKAILFDVDGTLYYQLPLRAYMIAELLREFLPAPQAIYQTVRYLKLFRAERESLRKSLSSEDLETRQYTQVCEKFALDEITLRQAVEEWIYLRPLKYLRSCRRKGLLNFLKKSAAQGLKLGVFSDYPAQAKLKFLECDPYIDLQLCSIDPEINAFKPEPAGILTACERWQIEPQELLYIGDRESVDGLAAEAAGCRFLLIGAYGSKKYSASKSYTDLFRNLSN